MGQASGVKRNDKLDLVLWGATGYTGRLVAAYLAASGANTEGKLRWGLAGRNRTNLESLRNELLDATRGSRHADALPLFVADSQDERSLATFVEKTHVVCSTVGPYALYGDALVRVVAAAGIGYCDITGETDWMHGCIARHQDEAARTGARIVHACGFDSIPSDLGTLMVQDEAVRRYKSPCSDVKFILMRQKGTFSGGTLASLTSFIERLGDPAVRRIAADPYALDPAGSPRGSDGPDQRGVRHDEDLGVHTGAFIMAGVNTRVVRRSHALLGHPWGEDFRYSESVSYGPGRKGKVRALAATAALAGFSMAMMAPPSRRLLQRYVLPKPGEGPSRAQREAGFFKVSVIGRGKKADGEPFRLRGTVVGVQDPGYGETAKMLGESALCLALDGEELPKRAGFLTPATAMGQVLIARLRAAGMTFDVDAM